MFEDLGTPYLSKKMNLNIDHQVGAESMDLALNFQKSKVKEDVNFDDQRKLRATVFN